MNAYLEGKPIDMSKIKKYTKNRIALLISLLLLIISLRGYSQTCEVTLRNDSLIDANNLVVDIYVRATSGTFYYSWGQYKISFNSAITNGGTISGTIVDGFSDLTNSTQLPPSIIVSSTYWRATAGQIPNSQAACSQISATGIGTRICRVRLTNTAVFAANAADMLIVTTAPNPTAVWYSDAGGFSVATTPSMVNGNLINPVLNGSLSLYNVNGGGTAPAPVGLSGSQSPGVNYLLIKDGSVSGAAVNGTGSAISFGNQTAGTYGVRAHRAGTYMYSDMSGNVTVTEACIPVTVATPPSGSAICAGGATSMSVILAGSAPYTYQWQYLNGASWESVANGNPAGSAYTGATTNSLSVSGITNPGTYQYRCYVTNCSGNNNNQSNPATVTVNAIPTITGTTSNSRCGTGTVVLGATASAGTINWYAAPTGGASLATGGSFTTPSIAATTTYYVDATSNGCTTADRTAVIATVNTVPTITGTTPGSRCGTGTVILGAAASAGTINWYAASTGGASLATGGSFTTPSIAATTTYYVDATNNGCTTATRTSIAATVNALPSVNAGTDQTIPNGTSTTLTGSVTGTGPFTYSWTPMAQVTTPSSLTTNTVNLSTTTVFTLTATSTSTTCVNSDQITVNVTGGALSASATATPGTVCAGTTVQLAANASGGSGTYNYAWTSSPAGFTSGSANPTVTPSANITYYVAVNDGFSTVNSQAAVTVNPIPAQPTVTVTQPTCSTATGTISVTAPTGTGMNYSIDGSTYTNTTGTFSSLAPGTYTVTARSSAGCTSPGRSVTVNDQPPTPVVGNQTTSINTGQTFTVTPTGTPTGTTYTWPAPTYTGGVTGGVAQATGVTSITGTLTIPTGTGTAIYTVTPTTGTCVGNPFTVTVTVSSSCIAVDITSNPANASICAGGSASFTVTATGTAPVYQWQYYNGSTWVSVANGTPAGAIYTNATTLTLGVSGITAPGSYQYRCTATNCSVSSDLSLAATLTVNAIPAQPTATVTQPTCSTATGTISVTAPTGTGMTYSIDGSTYTNTTGIFNSVAPGTYSVTARSSAGCTSPVRSVTVNDQPPTPVVGNQTTSINSGQTFTVTPSGTPTGTTYTWTAPTYTGGVTGGVAQSTGVTSITGTLTIPSGNGTAVYTVTPTAGTCVGNPFTVTVTVSSSCIPVVITADPSSDAICAGESASFSVTATGTAPVYQWEYFNGSTWNNVVNGTPSGAVYTNAATNTLGVAGITVAGSYQYRCNATNCSVSNDQSAAATLTVNAAPPQPTITADGPTTFCQGEDVVLSAPLSDSYLWSNGEITRSITVTASGNFTVQVANTAGCQSVPSGTTVVTVNPLPSRPTINPAGTVNICAGSSRTLTSSAGTTYLWSNGEITPSISVSTAGNYTVQVTNSLGCLSQPSLATTVVVNPLPATPTITASGPTAICIGSNVILTSSLSTYYLWSTGATTRSITVSNAGDYSVRVTDATTCQSEPSAVTTVTVNPLPSAPTVGIITQPTCSVATGSVVLSGLPATGNWTLTRSPGGAIQTGSGTTYTVTGLPAGSHTFTVTNSNGCISVASAAVVITTPPAVPTAPVVGTVTQPTCAVTTGSVGISGLPSSGTWTLTRNPGGAESTGSGTTFTALGIPAGTYTYTVTNAAGCVSPASASFTVNAPLPVPAVPVHTVDCSLGFNQARITVTSPTGTGYDYRLDAGSWQTSNEFNNVANGTHTVTARNSSGCTTTGPQFSVNCGCVNPPLLTLGATSGATCGLTAVTVSGNTFGGSATSVTISDNGGGTVTPASSATSPFSFTYTPVAGDAGRTVVITVTTNNPLGSPCAAASATYTLTVNALPVAPVPGTVTHPTCAVPTGSVILNSLPASGEWSITRNPGGQIVTGSGTSTTITGLAPGTYTFTVTNALGCVSAASSNVVINAQPDTPAAPIVGTITQPTCALSTGSVALSGLPATGNWTLTRIPGNVTINGSGTTRTVTAIPPGTYTFTVANAAGCASPASVEVVINAQPVTPAAPVIGTITHPTCELATGSIVLENMPETGEWTLIRYPGGSSSTGTGSSATISSLPAGTYNFAVRNADGCTSPVSANAVINTQPPTPTAPVVGTITHPTFQVATGSVVLSGLPASGTWILIRNPDGFTSQGTGTTRTVSGLEPGTYTFAVTNASGCTSAPTNDVVINARPGAPVLVINNPPTICENETTDLTAPAVTAGSDANLTFTYWTDAEATVAYMTPQAAPAGTYYIMGTSTAGYYTIKPVIVTADEIPVAYAGEDQELDYLFGTTLTADIPEIGTGIWALVSGTGDLFNSTAPSTAVSGLSVGENVFSWTVTNGACDPVTDLVMVRVNDLMIPTLITPNEDTRNDAFEIHGLETLGRTELIIFDRRGLKVWESRAYENDWDGRDYNSNPLPEDTYFYVLRAENGVSRSGYIVVRR